MGDSALARLTGWSDETFAVSWMNFKRQYGHMLDSAQELASAYELCVTLNVACALGELVLRERFWAWFSNLEKDGA